MNRPVPKVRAAHLRELERDVAAALGETGASKAAVGRLLSKLTSGTALENASAMRDLLTAASNNTVRAIYGGEGP